MQCPNKCGQVWKRESEFGANYRPPRRSLHGNQREQDQDRVRTPAQSSKVLWCLWIWSFKSFPVEKHFLPFNFLRSFSFCFKEKQKMEKQSNRLDRWDPNAHTRACTVEVKRESNFRRTTEIKENQRQLEKHIPWLRQLLLTPCLFLKMLNESLFH